VNVVAWQTSFWNTSFTNEHSTAQSVALDFWTVIISLLVTIAVSQRTLYSNISLPTTLVTDFPLLSGQLKGSAVATSLIGFEGSDGAPTPLEMTVGKIVPVVRGSNVEIFAEAEESAERTVTDSGPVLEPRDSEEFEAIVEVWPAVSSVPLVTVVVAVNDFVTTVVSRRSTNFIIVVCWSGVRIDRVRMMYTYLRWSCECGSDR
jgi:hypothetical protein